MSVNKKLKKLKNNPQKFFEDSITKQLNRAYGALEFIKASKEGISKGVDASNKTFENKNLELEEYKKNLKEDLDNKFSTSYETEEFNTYIQESLDGFKEDIFKEVYSRVEGEILKNLSNTRRPESSFKVENYDDSHKVGNFNQRVMNIKDITNEVFQEKSNSNPFQRVYKEIQKTE